MAQQNSEYKAALAVFAANKKRMSKEEFKEWLETFDLDKDGKISKTELQAAIRSCSMNAGQNTTADSKRSPKRSDIPVGAKGREDQMSVQEFKKWLMKFDKDNDGRISRDELAEAMRSRGVWLFPGLRASRTLSQVDTNRSGFIDDDKEIKSLLRFAEGTLGFKFT